MVARAHVQKYALDFQTLVVIEIAVFAVFEYKRYQNWKKDGHVRSLHPCFAPHLVAQTTDPRCAAMLWSECCISHSCIFFIQLVFCNEELQQLQRAYRVASSAAAPSTPRA